MHSGIEKDGGFSWIGGKHACRFGVSRRKLRVQPQGREQAHGGRGEAAGASGTCESCAAIEQLWAPASAASKGASQYVGQCSLLASGSALIP